MSGSNAQSVAKPGSPAVAETLGALLRQLRQKRGLSQNALSQRAGLASSTVSRWESDRSAPRLNELQALLTALEADTALNRRALALMQTPRSVHRLRALTGAPFGTQEGSLLWALRLRNSLTQQQASEKAGVAQSQIARWEKSETWPSTERLHAYCWSLGAHADEICALTLLRQSGNRQTPGDYGTPSVLKPIPALPQPEPWDIYLRSLLFSPPPDPLLDLTFIAAEQHLIRLAEKHAFAGDYLAALYAFYSRNHLIRHQEQQARYWTERGLAQARHQRGLMGGRAYWFGNVLVAASVQMGGEKRPGHAQRAAQMVRDWLPLVSTKDAHHAWGVSIVASYVAQQGEMSAALKFSDEACRLAQGVNPSEYDCRQFDRVRLLKQSGYFREAIAYLENLQIYGEMSPWLPVLQHLLKAECLLGLKDKSHAEQEFRCAEQLASFLSPAAVNIAELQRIGQGF